MKHFIAALCCLVVIAVFCGIGTYISTHIIDDILTVLHEAPTNLGEVPPQASRVSRRINRMWEEKFFIISMFHPHQHLDEVKEKMVVLGSYSDTDEYAEWKHAHAGLEEALLHLKNLLKANIDNIL